MASFGLGSRKFILVGLIIFVVFDILLAYLFFIRKNGVNKAESSLGRGEVFESPPDYQNGVFSRFVATGTVVGTPSTVTNDAIYVSLVFPTKNFFSSQKTLVYLGRPDKKVGVSFFDKNIGKESGQIWQTKSVREVASYLKPGTMVTIQIPAEKASLEKFSSFECDEICKKNIKDMNMYYQENVILAQIIEGQMKSQDSLNIGPIIQVMIFDK